MYLLGICRDTSRAYDIAQIAKVLSGKSAFREFDIKLILLQNLEHSFNMQKMIFPSLAIYQHIINKYHDEDSQKWSQHSVQNALKCC